MSSFVTFETSGGHSEPKRIYGLEMNGYTASFEQQLEAMQIGLELAYTRLHIDS